MADPITGSAFLLEFYDDIIVLLRLSSTSSTGRRCEMLKKFVLICVLVVLSAMVFAGIIGHVKEVDKYGNVHTDIPVEAVVYAAIEAGDTVSIRIGETTIVVPFVTTYGDVDRGSALARYSGDHVLLAINYGNFAQTYGLEVGEMIRMALVEKGAYKEELEIRHLVRTDLRSDYASDEVFANFREVTIGNIAPHRLYRCSHPSIDDPRAPYAAALVEAAGIKTVINLSDSDEELAANYAYSQYYRSIGEAGNLINLNMGVDLLSDEFSQKLKTGLLFMIEKEPPYLVHCVEGKDRAGMVAALLGAIMDAKTGEIYADYVKSYENYYKVAPGTLAYEAVEGIIADIFIAMNDGNPVDDSNIKEVALNYLKTRVGLSDTQIAALQAKLK